MSERQWPKHVLRRSYDGVAGTPEFGELFHNNAAGGNLCGWVWNPSDAARHEGFAQSFRLATGEHLAKQMQIEKTVSDLEFQIAEQRKNLKNLANIAWADAEPFSPVLQKQFVALQGQP